MIKKNLYIVTLFFVSFTFAQTGPKVSVQPTEYDFGKIKEGEKVSTNFVITNTGDDLLKIFKVRASCGCTAAKPDKDELKPGESTNLSVTFNSKGRLGLQHKMVYVSTNDSTNKEMTIKLTGDVSKEGDHSLLKKDKTFFKEN